MSGGSPRIGIVTISDRASRGEYADESGPAIEAALRDYLASECAFELRVIADERERIGAVLRELAGLGCCLICTTGGTGPAERDVTPEAIRDVCEVCQQVRAGELDVCHPNLAAMFELIALTGARLSEIRDLEWSCVRLDEGAHGVLQGLA